MDFRFNVVHIREREENLEYSLNNSHTYRNGKSCQCSVIAYLEYRLAQVFNSFTHTLTYTVSDPFLESG